MADTEYWIEETLRQSSKGNEGYRINQKLSEKKVTKTELNASYTLNTSESSMNSKLSAKCFIRWQ